MFRFLKKLFTNKQNMVEEKVAELNKPLENSEFCASLDQNIAVVKQLFSDVAVARYRTFGGNDKNPNRYFIVFFDGMVDSETINDNILKPLMLNTIPESDSLIDSILHCMVQVGEAKEISTFSQMIDSVTYGDTVLFAEGCNKAIVLNSKNFVTRAIDEPDNEKVLNGPREGFSEVLMQNLSQVVRRVRTHELKTKIIKLGRRTRTDVCVCYIESLVDKGILEELMNRLEKIEIDGMLDSNYITELIRDHPYSPFRTTGYTERPDIVVGKILEGRIAIFVDGSPSVLTIPYLFIENFQSNEDYYFSFYYTSFSRLLRILAFFLTIAVPGLYVAIVAFDQEMLPLQLLMKVALERQNVPLPAAIEAVIMLLVFDVLRETEIRMPSNIGQALSIVGALVIGQAAVEASLVAAPMIIVVAATGITSLLVPKLNAPVIYWRFIILGLSSFFGFFGFVIAVSILIIHVNSLTSFGIEQSELKGRFNFQDIKDILFRAPWWKMIDRPYRLSPNKVRQRGK